MNPLLPCGAEGSTNGKSPVTANPSGCPAFFGGSSLIRSIIAWSRILDTQEVLAAFNNDPSNELTAWVTIDNQLHKAGDILRCLYSSAGMLHDLAITAKNGKAVQLIIPKGGFVLY